MLSVVETMESIFYESEENKCANKDRRMSESEVVFCRLALNLSFSAPFDTEDRFFPISRELRTDDIFLNLPVTPFFFQS